MNSGVEGVVDWRARAAAAEFDLRPIIAGRRVDARGNVRVETKSAVTGSANLDYAACAESDVAAAVADAQAVWQSGAWSELPPVARKVALLRLADLVDQRAEQLAMCDLLDVGKPISAALTESHIAAHFIRWFGEAADKWHNGTSIPAGADCVELHLRRPRGVVAAIVPWNYPVINASLKFAPALAAGNCLVLKPSELSPRSALLLAELAVEAGIPPGALNVLPGDGCTGEALVRDAGIAMVAFTGSTRTGRRLMRTVGDSGLKPLQLECGGKSPEIVFADASTEDLSLVAAAIVGGSFANSGQLCVARTRIIVHASIYEQLLQKLVEKAAAVQCGDSFDPRTLFGPLASAKQKSSVLGYVESGVADGGRIELDGRQAMAGSGGAYVGPTILTGVGQSSRIVREEIFGPVLTVHRFRSPDEALELANESEYGLAATVWTRDLELAHRFAAKLRAGKVKIMATPAVTAGGGVAHESEPVGQSGFGVEGGIRGVETYTHLQAVEFSFGRMGPG